MSPWPGVKVEAGKRGGIKDVFGRRTSRPIFRSREMQIDGPFLRSYIMVVLAMKSWNPRSCCVSFVLKLLAQESSPVPPSPIQPFSRLNHQNAGTYSIECPKMPQSLFSRFHQNAGIRQTVP